MNSDRNEISSLNLRISNLEDRLIKLSEQHDKAIYALMRCGDILHNHRKAISAELVDAFDRIIQLELRAYPHLVRDLDDLQSIIGDHEGKAYNPLDFRDPTKSGG